MWSELKWIVCKYSFNAVAMLISRNSHYMESKKACCNIYSYTVFTSESKNLIIVTFHVALWVKISITAPYKSIHMIINSQQIYVHIYRWKPGRYQCYNVYCQASFGSACCMKNTSAALSRHCLVHRIKKGSLMRDFIAGIVWTLFEKGFCLSLSIITVKMCTQEFGTNWFNVNCYSVVPM